MTGGNWIKTPTRVEPDMKSVKQESYANFRLIPAVSGGEELI